MKGVIRQDHIPRNKYKFMVSTLPDLTVVNITGIEEELDTVDLPDRTKASGGRTKPVEFTITIPRHHVEEIIAMDTWWTQCQGDVLPSYKKTGVLAKRSLSGIFVASLFFSGLFVKNRNNQELSMDNDGEEDEVQYTLSADDVTP